MTAILPYFDWVPNNDQKSNMNPQDPDEPRVEVYYYFLNRFKYLIDEHYAFYNTPPLYFEFAQNNLLPFEMRLRFRLIHSLYWLERDMREEALRHAIQWDLDRHGVARIGDLSWVLERNRMHLEDVNVGSDLRKRKRVNSE